MNITKVGPMPPLTNVQNARSVPNEAATKATDSAAELLSPPGKTVDMSNVSLNEINELIKSGAEGLLDVIPFFIPPNIINEYGAEYAATIKVDALKQMEERIAFAESLGDDTTILKNVLNKLISLDGSELPHKINFKV